MEDVHEIIVHDYGSMYLISLHAEIPERLGPAEMHEIAERSERNLRKTFGGEAVWHTDPLMERTPEIQSIEGTFKSALKIFPRILGYHDFRVIAESPERIIIVADIDVTEDAAESESIQIAKDLQAHVKKEIPKDLSGEKSPAEKQKTVVMGEKQKNGIQKFTT